MKKIILVIVSLLALQSQARVEVLFHPYDSTLEKIVSVFSRAEKSIEIAMYNIDVTQENPIMVYLASLEMQNKIQRGLKIRMLFEGYGTEEENKAKMSALEKVGIDVRFLGKTQKIHHKFAVVDAHTSNEYLITGSANWSLSSRRNYNENILFIDQEHTITMQFLFQFEQLWSDSEAFGFSPTYHDVSFNPADLISSDLSLNAFFNYHMGKSFTDEVSEGEALMSQIVFAIDSAQDSIRIATTRLKLRPIYDAIVRAAQRGVKIQIVVSMGEFQSYRKNLWPRKCENAFEKQCSSGMNYAALLAEKKFKGAQNVEVRVKWTDMDFEKNLNKQMHNKYIIVDGREVVTGSFNWSFSSETNFVENLVKISGDAHAEVYARYNQDFERLWNMNRESYSAVLAGEKFVPMTLSFQEVDALKSGMRN